MNRKYVALWMVIYSAGCIGCAGCSDAIRDRPVKAYSLDDTGRHSAPPEIYGTGLNEKGIQGLMLLSAQNTAKSALLRAAGKPVVLVVSAGDICEAVKASAVRANSAETSSTKPMASPWAFVSLGGFDSAENIIHVDEIAMGPKRLQIRYQFIVQPVIGLLSIDFTYSAMWIPLNGGSPGNYTIEIINETTGASVVTHCDLIY